MRHSILIAHPASPIFLVAPVVQLQSMTVFSGFLPPRTGCSSAARSSCGAPRLRPWPCWFGARPRWACSRRQAGGPSLRPLAGRSCTGSSRKASRCRPGAWLSSVSCRICRRRHSQQPLAVATAMAVAIPVSSKPGAERKLNRRAGPCPQLAAAQLSHHQALQIVP